MVKKKEKEKKDNGKVEESRGWESESSTTPFTFLSNIFYAV